jgi:hypothetical protein
MTPRPRNTHRWRTPVSFHVARFAIRSLQANEAWRELPIEARRAICAARVHLRRAADALD